MPVRERPRLVVLTDEAGTEPPHTDRLRALADVTITDAAGLPAALPGAQVLLLWDFFSSALVDAWPAADALEWIHVTSAGVDTLLFDGLRASDVVVSNARGVFDQPIAEFVAASVLAHDKQLHASKRLQRDHTWQHRETTRTAGSRALVVGTGGIGRAIGPDAARARARGHRRRAYGATRTTPTSAPWWPPPTCATTSASRTTWCWPRR